MSKYIILVAYTCERLGINSLMGVEIQNMIKVMPDPTLQAYSPKEYVFQPADSLNAIRMTFYVRGEIKRLKLTFSMYPDDMNHLPEILESFLCRYLSELR